VISAIYNIVQESLTNIQKYAKASKVDIEITVEPKQLLVIVSDNGVGFDRNSNESAQMLEMNSNTVLEQKPKSRLKGGFGLPGMQERVELLRGVLTVDATVGKGTRILVSVPL
jgi:signal transduction histidine kinase